MLLVLLLWVVWLVRLIAQYLAMAAHRWTWRPRWALCYEGMLICPKRPASEPELDQVGYDSPLDSLF